MSDAPPSEPDTKDWTWILDRPCPDCAYDAATVDRVSIGAAVRANAEEWREVLASPGVTTRPAPTVWSPTEYAAHVRDVHRTFAERIALMLAEDAPRFPNWDQDATAVAERYDKQLPEDVAPALADAAERVAAAYDAVPPDAWGRPGARSDGSTFTVETLGRYHLHDVVHHLWDVG